jgi:hypothetical protein
MPKVQIYRPMNSIQVENSKIAYYSKEVWGSILNKASNKLVLRLLDDQAVLFVEVSIKRLKFVLKIYRYLPGKFAHLKPDDSLVHSIEELIKRRLFQTQMEYINREENRNTGCDVALV